MEFVLSSLIFHFDQHTNKYILKFAEKIMARPKRNRLRCLFIWSVFSSRSGWELYCTPFYLMTSTYPCIYIYHAVSILCSICLFAIYPMNPSKMHCLIFQSSMPSFIYIHSPRLFLYRLFISSFSPADFFPRFWYSSLFIYISLFFSLLFVSIGILSCHDNFGGKVSSRVTLAAIDRRICQHTKTRQHGCAQFIHWSKEECALTVNSSALGLICACLMQPHHLITHAWLPQGRVWKEDWFQGGKIKKRTILILLLITKCRSTTIVVASSNRILVKNQRF